jgi:hypothetical protein
MLHDVLPVLARALLDTASDASSSSLQVGKDRCHVRRCRIGFVGTAGHESQDVKYDPAIVTWRSSNLCVS